MRLRRRWSRTSKLFLLLAVASGAAAFLVVRGYAERLEALRPAVGQPVPVLVAASDLRRGTRLTADVLREQSVPSAYVQPGAVTDRAEAGGRTLVADLAAGEMLTRTRLGAEGAGPIAALVPPELRAVSIQLALPPGVVREGDHVDVLATFGGGRPYTETVAPGLEVLSVIDAEGTEIGAGGAGSTRAVVVLVSPEDAERLAYAEAFGDLSVAIAGPQATPDSAA